MKYITIAILWMLLATPALACVRTYDVEADRVDSFPIMGYIDELDSRDEIYFTIYIRETGNFEGLSGVSSEINDEEGSELFSGTLHMSRTDNEGLFRVGFRVGKEILEQGKLTQLLLRRETGRNRRLSTGLSCQCILLSTYIILTSKCSICCM